MQETPSTPLDELDLSRVLDRVVVSEEAAGRSDTQQILDRATDAGLTLVETLPELDDKSINQRYRTEKETLFLRVNKGSFIKPWESPEEIVGRDEWCLTPVEGCPLDCSYCYLQDYLDRPLIQVFVNQEKIPKHIRGFLEDPPEEPPHFFSLGELSDGLFLEPLVRTIPRVWEVFRDSQAKVEIRSKSHHVHGLASRLDPHSNGVFTWTLSPKGFDQRNEMLTAPFEKRLNAMKHMLDSGFRVSARIDPILLTDDWFNRYSNLIEEMDRYLDLSDLTFLLLGVFRFPKGFDRTMEERFSNRDFLRDEFVEGPDGKLRYARDLRTRVYERLGSVVRDFDGDPNLCMEPEYVWEDAGFMD
ncbi:MAG: radical SAM protein [bacterium]